MQNKKTDILILGAGIGGYEAFQVLSSRLKRHNIKKKITLIDQNNYFTFVPMLHEVASGAVQASHCAIPIRQCTYKTSHEFWQSKVENIDPEKRIVSTSEGTISYQYCLVALGSETNFYNIKGAQSYAHHVRSLAAAVRLQQSVVRALENKQLKTIHITIVGGGTTGVELAGQFWHLANHDAKLLYPETTIKINLVHAGETLLPEADPQVSRRISAKLKKYGINIMLDTMVKEVKTDEVIFSDNHVLPSTITVWTAGFKNIAPKFLPANLCHNNQIQTNEFLQHPKYSQLFAIGDIAQTQDQKHDKPYPQSGEVAHHQAIIAAQNIISLIQSKPLKSFNYTTKATLIPLGDWFAVAKLGNFVFSGRIAWWLRRTIYLMYIPGFLRKIRIMTDWTLHSLGFRYIIDLDLNPKKPEN